MGKSNGAEFYKPHDTVNEDHKELKKEDFILIMSSTQEAFLIQYGSDCTCADEIHLYYFELYTFLILDDLQEGFLCAFLISYRNDETICRCSIVTLKNMLE